MTEPLKPTPSSTWYANGEPDPHAGMYDDKRREDLALGDHTDDELANALYLYDHGDKGKDVDRMLKGEPSSMVYLTAAKDRIRWLSRKLQKAEDQLAAAQLTATIGEHKYQTLVQAKNTVTGRAVGRHPLLPVQLRLVQTCHDDNFNGSRSPYVQIAVVKGMTIDQLVKALKIELGEGNVEGGGDWHKELLASEPLTEQWYEAAEALVDAEADRQRELELAYAEHHRGDISVHPRTFFNDIGDRPENAPTLWAYYAFDAVQS